MKKKKVNIKKHDLIPKHVKASEREKKQILDQYQISIKELPKILKSDPALLDLNVEVGDMIKIMRKSPTAGESTYYRVVTNA
ncbi:MAG: DNA-directed RNA polymerase subunit H [Nanoarchaeota archaeon]